MLFSITAAACRSKPARVLFSGAGYRFNRAVSTINRGKALKRECKTEYLGKEKTEIFVGRD
jgi:hypothetical protein